jgi:hypothetical protein
MTGTTGKRMDTAAAILRAQSEKKLSKKNLNTREGRYKFAVPTNPGTAIFVATKYIPIRTGESSNGQDAFASKRS